MKSKRLRALYVAALVGISGSHSFSVLAQTTEKEALSKLSFMIGDWVGTSTSYDQDGSSESISVKEKVAYQLSGNLINLIVSSEALELQTVVRYSVEDGKYYYHPFTKNSTGEFEGFMDDEKFVVKFNDTYRLTFEKTDSGFREYGMKLKDGEWVKNFQDELHSTDTVRIDGGDSSLAKEYIGKQQALTDVISVSGNVAKTIYIGGQIGTGDSREKEFETAYKKIEQRLDEAGAKFSDVVKMSIYITNYNPETDLDAFFKVQKRLYSDNPMPTNVFIGVDSLYSKDVRVEMDAIAVLGTNNE